MESPLIVKQPRQLCAWPVFARFKRRCCWLASVLLRRKGCRSSCFQDHISDLRPDLKTSPMQSPRLLRGYAAWRKWLRRSLLCLLCNPQSYQRPDLPHCNPLASHPGPPRRFQLQCHPQLHLVMLQACAQARPLCHLATHPPIFPPLTQL